MMRVLFDQGTPAPLRRALAGHEVTTTHELGWSELANGDLLKAAEGRFELLITTDQGLRYQQNRTDRQLAIIVLMTTSWPRIRTDLSVVVQTVEQIRAGEYVELPFP